MKCPRCNGKTGVVETRHPSPDEILRERVCKSCGYIFHTMEFEVEFDDKFMRHWQRSARPTTRKKVNKNG